MLHSLSCNITPSLFGARQSRDLPTLHPWLYLRLKIGSLLIPQRRYYLTDQVRNGNDGPWSTFALQIGTPPQTVKVLASTASNEIWAIALEGCQSQLGDPTGCESLRGEFYNYSASSTWDSNLSNASTNIYALGLESSLNYTGNGRYGFDDITLGYIGSGGPTLKNQTIAGIATKSFFMGLFGLTPRSSNFTSLNNPTPSFMQNLRNQSMIPSLSWAYTAGNQYRTLHLNFHCHS